MISDNHLSSLFPHPKVHEQQLRVMECLLDCIEQGGVSVIESPTGTGKTLMLLSACLHYLLYADDSSISDNYETEPEWMRKFRRQANANANPVKPAKKKTAVDKLLSIDIFETSKEAKTVFDVLLDAKNANPNSKWKIVYASRTHTQIAQVIREWRRFDQNYTFGLKAKALGGRSQLCINENVKKSDDPGEACVDLLQSNEEENQCPYFAKEKSVGNVEALSGEFQSKLIIDIEDAVEMGRTHRACPYYTLKHVPATLTVLPYSLLFGFGEANPVDSSASTIEIDANTIVILDEAHNLVDWINEEQSATVLAKDLQLTVDALNAYTEKYGKRLSGHSLAMCQQLLFTLGNILRFMLNPPCDVDVNVNVLPFMQSTNIDTINLSRLVRFVRESKLSFKLKIEDKYLLLRICKFLDKLSEQSANGTVLVRDGGADKDDVSELEYINLNPSIRLMPIVEKAKAVILAGGTMTPESDLIDALFPSMSVAFHSFPHVISNDRFIVNILTHGPCGREIDLRMANRHDDSTWREVAMAVNNLMRITPRGMCVFFASFSLLEAALESWHRIGFKFNEGKQMFVEERNKPIEDLLRAYSKCANGLLLAVIGGRLSEGVNLNDDLCRTLVIVGVPYLNKHDLKTKLRHSTGASLHNAAMRKVNQTMGRCLRHAHDYANIVLIDSRYADCVNSLPKWMAPCLRVNKTFGELLLRTKEFFKTMQ